MSFSVLAACPTQQTTIFFANGVNVDKDDGPTSARKSMKRLEEELIKESLKDSRVRFDCIQMDLAYNTNEPTFITDFVEALIQKTAEETGVDNFPWGQWLLAETPLEYYQAFIKDALFLPVKGAIDAGRFVLGDQRDEHIAKFQTEIGLGRQVLLASHSQGSINSKEERTIMTEAERLSTRIVSAAAFSFPEPDETRYTTLNEDNLAVGGFGFPTPPTNIILGGFLNPSPCRLPTVLPVYCHDFIQAYMTIPESRNKIVADIVAALPITPVLPPGTVFSQPDSSETITGFDGFRRWTFQNLEAFPQKLNTITVRLKAKGENTPACNYVTRVEVTLVDGDLHPFPPLTQEITTTYTDYTFDFSGLNIPLAQPATLPHKGLYHMTIASFLPDNPCFEGGLPLQFDVAGVNRDVSPYTSPRLNSFETFPADPYIVVTGR